jgi:PiT family inorganic phosphate transporter
MSESMTGLRVIVGNEAACAKPFSGTWFGLNGQKVLDIGHFLSAGAVSFARGLNDTPKIVALGLVAGALDLTWSIVLVAAIAFSGMINGKVARRSANASQTWIPTKALANGHELSRHLLFHGACRSTTHVSCGALFGIGVANGQAR